MFDLLCWHQAIPARDSSTHDASVLDSNSDST